MGQCKDANIFIAAIASGLSAQQASQVVRIAGHTLAEVQKCIMYVIDGAQLDPAVKLIATTALMEQVARMAETSLEELGVLKELQRKMRAEADELEPTGGPRHGV